VLGAQYVCVAKKTDCISVGGERHVGADQYLLPHLGAQARILLDHFVASGTAGIDGRDIDDWVLSRLIQRRYVAESTSGDTIFVCTPAGRHRWQIEFVADEKRNAFELRRLLIRRRLDERFTRLGIETSTALAIAYVPEEPRLHRRVPAPWNPPSQTRSRLSSPLAAMFAATAVALVMISASSDERGGWDRLFVWKPHAAAVLADQLKGNVGQTVPVVAPAATPVAAIVDPYAEAGSGHTADLADAAPATRQAASVVIITPSQKQGPGDITYRAEQDVSVPDRVPVQVELDGREVPAVAVAASPDDGAILNSALTAVALIDAAMRESGHFAADLTADTESGFRSTAAALADAALSASGLIAADVTAALEGTFKPVVAALLNVPADMERAVSELGVMTRQVRDDAPAPVVPAEGLQSEREQPAALQPASASRTESESVWAASVPASPNERMTATSLPARRAEADVDPQHAAVERLNKLSLAAARRGEAWRPNRRPM
jgi:hypothetical protein